MKLLEWVLDSSIRRMLNIDEMQFIFVPGRGTTIAIFIVHQLQEKYITNAKKWLYFAFVDIKKPSIMCQEMSCGRPWGSAVWVNGLCMASRACTTMPGAVCGSIVNTVRSLAWELVCFRILPLAHCSSSWCWKRCCVSSTLVCRGSFSMLMTGAHLRHPGGVYLQAQGMEGWQG